MISLHLPQAPTSSVTLLLVTELESVSPRLSKTLRFLVPVPGLILSIGSVFDPLSDYELFNDEFFWTLPSEPFKGSPSGHHLRVKIMLKSNDNIQGYEDTSIQRYKDTNIQGYKDTRAQRYQDTKIQG